jgi:hypothetical protein
MNEIKNNFSINKSSEKNFGITFGIIFFIIALFPLYQNHNINYLFLIISFFIFFVSFFFANILFVPNKYWFKFGMILGHVISQFVMLFIFFSIFLPIGFIFKILRKDLINSKVNKSLKSYWIDRNANNNSMDNQF